MGEFYDAHLLIESKLIKLKNNNSLNMAANEAEFLPLTSENLITAFQNEPILWNFEMRATEDKELAWRLNRRYFQHNIISI